MKLHGYCTGCRRIKRVRVTGNALAVSMVGNSPITGLCEDCENPPKPPQPKGPSRGNK